MIFHCEFWQKLPNCSHSLQQRVARFVLCFPPLTLLSARDSQFTICTTKYTTMNYTPPSWHCCQGAGKNHQTIFFQQLKGSCTKRGPSCHTSTSEGTSWGSTASSVPFIFSSEQKKLLVYALFDGRDQLLSPNSLTAARPAALVFNKLLFCGQFQRIK